MTGIIFETLNEEEIAELLPEWKRRKPGKLTKSEIFIYIFVSHGHVGTKIYIENYCILWTYRTQ